MNKQIKIESIGEIQAGEKNFSIKLAQKYILGLKNITGFSHLQIIWWAHLTDNNSIRNAIILPKLFTRGPEKLGVFATRSPSRPNPLMISIIQVQEIDYSEGIIYTPFIDAENGTPVLDIKPYYLMERVKDCTQPDWCGHWPQWFEEVSNFDWNGEINR